MSIVSLLLLVLGLLIGATIGLLTSRDNERNIVIIEEDGVIMASENPTVGGGNVDPIIQLGGDSKKK